MLKVGGIKMSFDAIKNVCDKTESADGTILKMENWCRINGSNILLDTSHTTGDVNTI